MFSGINGNEVFAKPTLEDLFSLSPLCKDENPLLERLE